MNRIFNLLLIVCALVLVLHVALTLAADLTVGARWTQSDRGRAFLEAHKEERRGNIYALGGEAANSALVVNLNGEGDPATVDAVEKEIFFDHEGQGRLVRSGWIGPGAAFLVFVDEEGKTELTGKNLYGNNTLGVNPLSDTGFDTLAFDDYNGDGLVDPADDTWPGLRLWVDADADGRVGEGELKTPAELGIVSFDLAYEKVGRFLPSHNYLGFRGQVNFADGRRGSLDEVYFQRLPGPRRFAEKVPVSPEIEAIVPDIPGSGYLRDLREAAALSPRLLEAIIFMGQTNDRLTMAKRLTVVMDAWAATGRPMADAAKRAEGRYRLTSNCLSGLNDWRRSMSLMLEAWSGSLLYRLPDELYPGQSLNSRLVVPGPGEDELALLCPEDVWKGFEMAYVDIRIGAYYKFLRLTRLKEYYQTFEADSPAPDFSGLIRYADQRFAENPDLALTDILEVRVDLMREGLNIQAAWALDDYLFTKVPRQPPSDEELSSLIEMVMKSVNLARMEDRKERMTRQWGVDKISRPEGVPAAKSEVQ